MSAVTLESVARTARMVPLSEMYPAPWNPRKIERDRLLDLRRSMDADPGHLWARPQMVREDGMVIGGNQRLRAALLGPDTDPPWPEEPYEALPAVDMHGLTDDEAQVIALRDNQGYGVWVDADVAAILGGLGARGVDLGLTGFTSEHRTHLLDTFDMNGNRRAAKDPDEAPPVPEEPTSVLGEVYELGRHRLIVGDCTDPEVIAKLMGDEQADVLWTDPPYGVEYVGKTKDALVIAGDALSADGTRALVRDALASIQPHLRGGATWYIASPSGDQELSFRLALVDVGWQLRQELVWVKDQFVMGRMPYHWRHETVLFGWLKGGRKYFKADHTQDTVLQYARPRRSTDHPTMKPTALIDHMLKLSSKVDDLVLDCFGGSGSTLISAEGLGRRCFICELDPRYADVIRARYEDYTAPMEPAEETT